MQRYILFITTMIATMIIGHSLPAQTGDVIRLTSPPGAIIAAFGSLNFTIDTDGYVIVPGFMAQTLVRRGFTAVESVPDSRTDLATSPYAHLFLEACGDHSARPLPPLEDGSAARPAMELSEVQKKALTIFDGGKCHP